MVEGNQRCSQEAYGSTNFTTGIHSLKISSILLVMWLYLFTLLTFKNGIVHCNLLNTTDACIQLLAAVPAAYG